MLELGGGFVSQIAKKAGKHRATSYHTLNNLVDKGFATKFDRGKYQYFAPESPEKLVTIASANLKRAESLLPQLLSIQNQLSSKPKITFYERTSGIEEIFEDTLTAEDEILGYTNLTLITELFPDFFKRYTKMKFEKGIKTRYLSPEPLSPKMQVKNFFPAKGDPKLLEVLFVNPTQFAFENEIAIYGRKVAIMSLSKKEQIGILIESATLSQTMKAVFDLAWLGATAFIAH